MKLAAFLAAFLTASAAWGALDIYPLSQVRAGQHGVGRTVFSGTRIEEFQVEILGVLKNNGPKQSIILAKLSGGPLAETGVMQGMSGSPVYIDGKLVGAVALGFTEAKEAIAGIRPIEDMLKISPDVAESAPKTGSGKALLAAVPPRERFLSGGVKLEEIATPLAFTGFTAATIDHFAPQLRKLGLDPQQGVSGGGDPGGKLGDPKTLLPGSMISVHLMSGDMSVSADGTVTAVDGDKLYAFGHRFMAMGPTDLPFAKAEVLALLPNLSNSFKISQATEWMGTITADRDTAISGLEGRRAALAPMEIRIGSNVFHMQIVKDRVLAPLVTQMAVFSAIDSTQRSQGTATYTVKGSADFEGGSIRLDNVYSGDSGTPAVAALGVETPLAYALDSGFDALRLKQITLDIAPSNKLKQLQIDDVVAPRTAHPGDDIPINITLSGENGAQTVRQVHYKVPVGAPAGMLYFTVSDASSANLLELQNAFTVPAHSAHDVLALLNDIRPNTGAYVRVWRSDGVFSVDGRDLPDPPASLAAILTKAQVGSAVLANTRGTTITELQIPAAGNMVSGTKTIQVEVKE